MTIGARLKAARKGVSRVKLTQEIIAKEMGMARTTLTAIESGQRGVKADELRLFSRLYEVSTEWLLTGEPQPGDPRFAKQKEMNIFDEAIDSVIRRGFHDAPPHENFTDAALMRQFVRLTEEAGELARALRGKGDIASETLDGIIVGCQILHLLGMTGNEIADAMRAKLAADEERGYLHGERH